MRIEDKYVLRQMLTNRGCYSEITFEITFDKDKESSLKVCYEADALWEASCKAGILIFNDFFSKKNKGELSITISKIDWMPVDTNNLIILYSTIKGLSELLDFEIVDLNIDRNLESFVIPEPRKMMIK